MLLSAYERETVINYNQNDQEASIYTFDPKLIVRLEKLASKYPQMFRLETQGEIRRSHLYHSQEISLYPGTGQRRTSASRKGARPFRSFYTSIKEKASHNRNRAEE